MRMKVNIHRIFVYDLRNSIRLIFIVSLNGEATIGAAGVWHWRLCFLCSWCSDSHIQNTAKPATLDTEIMRINLLIIKVFFDYRKWFMSMCQLNCAVLVLVQCTCQIRLTICPSFTLYRNVHTLLRQRVFVHDKNVYFDTDNGLLKQLFGTQATQLQPVSRQLHACRHLSSIK